MAASIAFNVIAWRAASGVFESPGIDFLHARDRLRYPYYRRWMLHPLRIDLQTKMPRLVADGRTTSLSTVYEGDAVQQFDAIWHFIQTLK